MIAAFQGWNDAGDAASTAGKYLAGAWDAKAFASIDPEEFYDFTSTRPQVRLSDGETRRIEWPTNELSYAELPGLQRDVVFFQGVEPQLRWRTFAATIAGIAQAVGVELVLSLGALLAEVPHTRPVRITGTAQDAALIARLDLQRSRYEGPTGIVGVLHDALGRSGLESASLWAAVPHYIGQTPSPKATLALVERTADLLGVAVNTADLDMAAAAYERQVNEVVAADEDASAYVKSLEEADEREELHPPMDAAGGDALAAEVERYLRDHPHNGVRYGLRVDAGRDPTPSDTLQATLTAMAIRMERTEVLMAEFTIEMTALRRRMALRARTARLTPEEIAAIVDAVVDAAGRAVEGERKRGAASVD